MKLINRLKKVILYFPRIYLSKKYKYYLEKSVKNEYLAQQYSQVNERPVEYKFVFESLSKTSCQSILDVGTGLTSLPDLMRTCGYIVTAIDNVRDYWKEGMNNRHYYVVDDDITNTKLTQKFDFITCVSVLEHIKNYDAAVKGMFSLLKEGGHLLLTFPYNENNYIENVYKLPGSNAINKTLPFSTQVYSRVEINKWIELYGGKLIEQEYWQFYTEDYWTVGERIQLPIKVGRDDKHQISCILIQKI